MSISGGATHQMPTLTIIVGMAGSGKTTLGNRLAREGTRPKFFEDATLTNSNRKRAGFDCLGEIVARLRDNDDCIMDEAHLCDPDFRTNFIDFCRQYLQHVTLEWIFFEKDPVACIRNLEQDARTKKEKNEREDVSRYISLRNQISSYELPAQSDIRHELRQVHRTDNPSFDETSALAWLDLKIQTLSQSKDSH